MADEEGAGSDGGGSEAVYRVLIVADASSSMEDQNAALGFSMEALVEALSLASSDWAVGITTSSVDPSVGSTVEVDPGEAGSLLGGLVRPSDPGPAEALRGQLFCLGTAWSSSALPRDPGYACGDDPNGRISVEYLDCLCGIDAWQDHSGSGSEEPLEAGLLALCRAGSTLSADCLDPASPLSEADAGSNAGLLAEGGVHLVLSLSDEGDSSRRLSMGDDSAALYVDLLSSFGDVRWSAIGPGLVDGAIPCNEGGATPWGTARVVGVTVATGGLYAPIATLSGSACVDGDPADVIPTFVAVGAAPR